MTRPVGTVASLFRARFLIPAAAVLVLGIAALIYLYLPDYSKSVQQQKDRCGLAVTDRNGSLLRIFPDGKGSVGIWCANSRIPSILKESAIQAEDQRFYHHWGFDPAAMIRAAYTNVKRGKTVSGASTITQQVVRLIHPRKRTYAAKILETLESLKMEWQLSKEDILELYFNLCPMGGNMRGVGLASRLYFGKDIEKISLSEAAVLAAIPRSPSRYDPRRNAKRPGLLAEKDRILRRMAANDKITEDRLKIALGPTVTFRCAPLPLEAPHFVDLAVCNRTEAGAVLKTTVDLDMQQSLERIVRGHRGRLRHMGISQAAAVVVSTDALEILAMVGSFQYGDRGYGYNNGATAMRSAGSTLKPFLYALALEKGYEAFSEIPDTFRSYRTPHGDYLPTNADRRSYGPVTMRTALGNSLNISAVKVLHTVGTSEFHDLLKHLELASSEGPPASHYGLGLAIGNLEVSLLRLVQAYGALARGGNFGSLRMVSGEDPGARLVFSPETAFLISEILADPSARLLTFGNPDYLDFGFAMPIKTGTSSNYRDDWIVGYTPRHVVGIWAGNFDGRSTSAITGARVCGPMLKDIVRHLYAPGNPGSFTPPQTAAEARICWMSGKAASDRCPHTSREYSIHRKSEIPRCDLSHEQDHHFVLGAQYAQWLHRRETEQGKGRFRLMKSRLSQVIGESGLHDFPAKAPHAGVATGRAKIRIVNPHDSDRFILSYHFPNRVIFRALPESVVDHVTWVLDGTEIARTGPPYELVWEMSRGKHVLHALTPSREAAQVTFSVE